LDIVKVFIFTFYENLVYGFGGTGGGDTSTGAGISGDEIVLEGGGLLLFEDFHAVGSVFGVSGIAASAPGGAIGSGFSFILLISCFSFTSFCSSFGKSFHWTSSTFAL
jgi:hypothetical protein